MSTRWPPRSRTARRRRRRRSAGCCCGLGDGAVRRPPRDGGGQHRPARRDARGARGRRRLRGQAPARLPRVLIARPASPQRKRPGDGDLDEQAIRHAAARLNRTLTLGSDGMTQAVPTTTTRRRLGVDADHPHYKWWALSCTSLGMLMATINSGTLIIALPDLERALDTTLELVWVILAYMIASTVLVLTAGRLSDLFGRKNRLRCRLRRLRRRLARRRFAGSGTELILWRIVQGIGGAFLFANSARAGHRRLPEGAARPGHGHEHDGRRRRPRSRPGARRRARLDPLALGVLVQRALRLAGALWVWPSCASSPRPTAARPRPPRHGRLSSPGSPGSCSASPGGLSGWTTRS